MHTDIVDEERQLHAVELREDVTVIWMASIRGYKLYVDVRVRRE